MGKDYSWADLQATLITKIANWHELLGKLESKDTLPDKLTANYEGMGFHEPLFSLVNEYNKIPKGNHRKFEIAQEILAEIDYAIYFE